MCLFVWSSSAVYPFKYLKLLYNCFEICLTCKHVCPFRKYLLMSLTGLVWLISEFLWQLVQFPYIVCDNFMNKKLHSFFLFTYFFNYLDDIIAMIFKGIILNSANLYYCNWVVKQFLLFLKHCHFFKMYCSYNWEGTRLVKARLW